MHCVKSVEMTEVSSNVIRRLPVLALVGRPNVGKSTLFNRLAGQRKAIVDDLPGVTRDRNYSEVEWYGQKFLLIDTGGFEPDSQTPLKKQVQEQTRLAIEEADVVLFLFDGKAGLNPLDRDAVNLLRKVNRPVLFAVNKIDTQAKTSALYEFFALGLKELFPLSAEHGLGLSELMDRIVDLFPPELKEQKEDAEDDEAKSPRPMALAIVGRPNVGKSTLVNRLLGYERSVVDAEPGTTRDAVYSPFTFGGERYTLVDTAGIRRKARIADRVERYSVIRSLRSVDRGDLVICLLDGPEGLVLAVNKWDLAPQERRNLQSASEQIYRKLAFVDFAPLVFISALNGFGIEKMMEAAQKVVSSYQRRIQTSLLNQVLRDLFTTNPPPLARGRQVKFFYATQTASRPPTFTLFVNSPKGIASSYERYLIHQARPALGLQGSPIRLVLRARREEKVKGLKGSRGAREKRRKGARGQGRKRWRTKR
jgi:GTP-binding protein